MNPSSSGWIKKFGHLLNEETKEFKNFDSLYQKLREFGFVYGIHLYYAEFIRAEHTLTEDEVAKINLLTAHYFIYKFEKKSDDFGAFVTSVLDYYKEMELGTLSLWSKIFVGKSPDAQLEKLMDSRIYLDDNIFSRTFGNSLTNSLLIIDALIYRHYLSKGVYAIDHARLLEYLAINVAYHALNSKESGKNDEKMVQLLYSSLTFVDFDHTEFDGSYRNLLDDTLSTWEKEYLLDVACLTVWEDKSLDYLESEFIFGLGKDLGMKKNEVLIALEAVKNFFEKNVKKIPYLADKNLASQFYDGMSKNVSKLILRNSKRLKKELVESKELMVLLTKSTTKELTIEEKKKIQNQLLDVFKSIPSLAIFILPGGAILLPIFIKLIPALLPSAFDDNRVEENP